jgi:transposase
MARRTFEVIDIVEILVHWHAGRSKNEIAASLGVDRKTIRKYVGPAEAAGLVPGGPPLGEAEWTARTRDWFPELTDTTLRQVTWPEIAKYHEYVADQLKAGVTVSTVHQRLVDEHGLAVSVASLRRYVRANMTEEARRSQVTVRALVPAAPGEVGEVDYGRLGVWTDPATGARRTVWAFVLVLPASRHLFVRPVVVMDQHAWTVAHVAAFGFFGGAPARLVPDNLKTGVDRPDLYDPKLNRSFAELAAHYGVLVDPARAFRPKDKPHVERQMPYVRDSFWRGRTFTSLEQMQDEAVAWCTDVAGELVKTHPRKVRGKQTDLNDYPPEKIAFHLRTPAWCRAQAEKVGPACVALVGGLLAENALYRLRAAQGVLGLADRHNPTRLEAACAKATAAGDPSYRTMTHRDTRISLDSRWRDIHQRARSRYFLRPSITNVHHHPKTPPWTRLGGLADLSAMRFDRINASRHRDMNELRPRSSLPGLSVNGCDRCPRGGQRQEHVRRGRRHRCGRRSGRCRGVRHGSPAADRRALSLPGAG